MEKKNLGAKVTNVTMERPQVCPRRCCRRVFFTKAAFEAHLAKYPESCPDLREVSSRSFKGINFDALPVMTLAKYDEFARGEKDALGSWVIRIQDCGNPGQEDKKDDSQ